MSTQHRISPKTGLVIVATIVGLAGLVMWSAMGLTAYRVEVCVAYDGRTACRTASGADKESAQRTASDNACAQISSGMTDSMACGRSVPTSVKWLDATSR